MYPGVSNSMSAVAVPPSGIACSFMSNQERAAIVEKIRNFLMEFLPAEHLTSPQRAHELAIRFEQHVAATSTSKEHYQSMIAEKLWLIRTKSEQGGVPVNGASNGTEFTGANPASTVSAETMQVSARLQQLQVQLFPQLDHLIVLHTQLQTDPSLVARLQGMRSALEGLISRRPSANGAGSSSVPPQVTLQQLNASVEQIQRWTAALNSKAKEIKAAAEDSKKSQSVKAESAAPLEPKQSLKASLLPHEQTILQRLSVPVADEFFFSKASDEAGYPVRHAAYHSRHSAPTALQIVALRDEYLDGELVDLKAKGYRIVRDESLSSHNLVSLIVGDPQGRREWLFEVAADYPYNLLLFRLRERTKGSDVETFKGRAADFQSIGFPQTISQVICNWSHVAE